MSVEDRVRWDERYARRGPPQPHLPGPPRMFAPYADLFPVSGRALDVACGQGEGAVWLAARGLEVWGLDVSPVAIQHARALARQQGVESRCRLEVVDLDRGLPPGPTVDVILCHRFRDARLDDAMIERLGPGGLLALSALSEVDAEPGPFRVTRGELPSAFAVLETIVMGEGGGEAWLLARA